MTDEANRAVATPLYKYVDIAGLKRILQGDVRFTQPSAFNDPFELLPEIVVPNDADEQQLNVSFDVVAQRRHQPPGTLSEVPKGCQASDAMSRDIVQQLNGLIGILCLSRIDDSLLMWSHYADQYAGVVVEFDGSHEFFHGQIDVEYRPMRPMRDVAAYRSARDPIPVAELCAKSEQWSYEQEVRIIRCLADCEKRQTDPRGFPVYTQRLPLECIKSVTLGERTPVADQRAIYDAVKDTQISLSLAAIDHRGYAFRRELIKMAAPVSTVNPWLSPRTAHIFSHLETPFGEVARYLIAKHPMSKTVNKPV
ncbi:MAG: DUF2971 domain-containing protein [Pseudomonadota bacterium]